MARTHGRRPHRVPYSLPSSPAALMTSATALFSDLHAAREYALVPGDANRQPEHA
jgi:hypothetical protein